MTYSEIQQFYRSILNAILSNKLREALETVEQMIAELESSEINQRLNTIKDTYNNMLRYSFEMAPDPQRQKIYKDLQISILSLTDDVQDLWVMNQNLFNRKSLFSEQAQTDAMVYSKPDELLGPLSSSYVSNDPVLGPGEVANRNAEQEKLVRSLFTFFWLKNKYRDIEIGLFRSILESNEIDLEIKSQMTSALSLSLLRHFDREKFLLLFSYAEHNQAETRQRALIGFFICVLAYHNRLPLYSDIMGRIEAIPDNELMQERMLAILLQFIRASETEKLTKKIQEEIVPEVLKIRSELEDKLKLEDLLSKESFDDKNPEWEDFFKDSPDVYEKLEQFSKMQTEGADVFMGAFAMLKHFPFFNEMPNWFLPFKGENMVVQKAFEGISESVNVPEFVEGLEMSTVMCNSDKYSFCLNISHMPAEQRKMMLDLFSMEMKAMNEVAQDEIKLDQETKSKLINTQYLQDLYRFFKLHPGRKEYLDLFSVPIDIRKNNILRIIFDSKKGLKSLAEFYFSRDAYTEALSVFEKLNQGASSFELYEKMAFCQQKLGQYEKAIELYKKAELFDKHKLWLKKKLGFCYRKIGYFQKAIDFYKEIILEEPKDLNNLAYLGQLHIDIEDFEEALQYYYKVEYEQPKNIKVCRPIGWSSFVLGKYDTAIKYFGKVIETNPNKSDYLNIGHSYWASGETGKALESYRKAVSQSGGDQEWFRNTFMMDSKYLKKTGVEDLDVMLMIDYVLM